MEDGGCILVIYDVIQMESHTFPHISIRFCVCTWMAFFSSDMLKPSHLVGNLRTAWGARGGRVP